ncbi:endonuclease [Nocardioides rubriscoriae]|uniref:endonuclease n=1 Tax=Nocardioides rubriscoriae TaxID=642762 RepID=UPI0011DFCA2E|nr:endonuclease [Nocardioides rubriscoriae]
MTPGFRRSHALAVLALLLLVPLLAVLVSAPAQAATVTVASARATQDGSTTTVRGYVVGQPTSTTTVVRSGYPSDYALALADSAGVTDPAQMLYVQIPSAFRSAWGLRTNPGLLGTQIDVTGTLAAYFSHPGLTGATAFALAGGTAPGGGATGGTTAYDSTYWKNALGRSGAGLESSLHTIISSGVTAISYDAVWNALKVTDRDPANSNNVILLYQGTSMAASNYGGGVDQWNREHVWAKSHGDFGTATGPGTDLHHLRPTDVTVNAARGNLDFDEGGSPNAEAPGNYADADSWEPRDADKGDVARMIFYMSVRYEGGDGFPDLEVNDLTGNGTAPYLGKLSVLLRWNAQDPPSAAELRRNDVIYATYQHNRNPFIDHPEWADSIW